MSSSSLLQTPSSSATSTSIIPDDAQITNTSSPAPTSGDGLSTGAVVGIAVGCLVAGVIIGLLVSLFLLHRRRKPAPAQVIEIRAGDKRPDSRALTATPVEPIAPVSDLDHFLPVPTSDKELAAEMQSLGYLIQQHVENNYHLSPVRPASGPLGQMLVDLGLGEGDSSLPRPEQLAAMALDPNTRFAALQHVIARVIFGSLSVESAGKISMLPPSVPILVREMPPCEKHMGNPEGISQGILLSRCTHRFTDNFASHLRCPGALAPDHGFPAQPKSQRAGGPCPRGRITRATSKTPRRRDEHISGGLRRWEEPPAPARSSAGCCARVREIRLFHFLTACRFHLAVRDRGRDGYRGVPGIGEGKRQPWNQVSAGNDDHSRGASCVTR